MENNVLGLEYECVDNEKPDNWPANEHERILETLWKYMKEFKNNPSYKTRERLLSLTSEHDLNQNIGTGWFRVTEYEVCIINSLYLEATACNINSIKTFLYCIVGHITRLHKFVSQLPSVTNSEILPYERELILPMRLYYFTYHNFTVEKEKSFAEQLIEIVESILSLNQGEEEIAAITYAYSSMLLDISNMHGSKIEKLWEFTRDELYKLLKLEAKLLKKMSSQQLQGLPKVY